MPNLSYRYRIIAGLWLVLGGFALPGWANSAATTTILTLTWGSSPVTTVSSGSAVTLTAAVMVGTTPVTAGQVNFCDASAAHCMDIHVVGTAQLTSAGTASWKFVPGPGSHSYKAIFAGTNNNATSTSSTSTLTVTPPTPPYPTATTLAQSGSPGNYTLTATVFSSFNPAPTGTISFLDQTDSNAVLSTSSLAAGSAGPLFANSATLTTASGPRSSSATSMETESSTWSAPPATCFWGMERDLPGWERTSLMPAASYAPPIAAGDFNGDGRLNLVVFGGLLPLRPT